MDRAQAYDERLPLPALAARVRTVWIQRTGPRPVLQRNLPTGGVELQCPIGATPRLVTTTRDGVTIYRVVIGPFTTRDEAERIARTSGKSYWVYEGAP